MSHTEPLRKYEYFARRFFEENYGSALSSPPKSIDTLDEFDVVHDQFLVFMDMFEHWAEGKPVDPNTLYYSLAFMDSVAHGLFPEYTSD